MIIIGGTIKFDPTERGTTMAAIQRMVAASRAEEGCTTYEFSADLAAQDILHLFEVWTSAEALAAHGKSAHMAEFKLEVSPKFSQTNIKRYTGESVS